MEEIKDDDGQKLIGCKIVDAEHEEGDGSAAEAAD